MRRFSPGSGALMGPAMSDQPSLTRIALRSFGGAFLAAGGVALAYGSLAQAQAIAGFNSNQPVNYAADRIELQDKQKRVVLSGKRVVFDGQARAIDTAAPDAATELRRKIRTLAGNFQLVAIEPRLLLPIVNPVWLQFVSHKLGRLLVPYALLLIFGASTMLASSSVFFGLVFAAQIGFYGLAVYGAVLEQQRRPRDMGKVEAYREAA